jgi:exodeoxyribonuclease-1
MSYVFYDTETTGTDKVFDQILQFAAVRTDDELNELEHFSIRSRLLPYVVPSPGAMQVTGISAAQLISGELPTHYTMVRGIRDKLLAWRPALFIGYNSLEFDEHLLRQALYQTLHVPYLTNTDGNCRADVLRAVRASVLFAPGALMIPSNDEGNPSFKLDKVAPANGFDHTLAHDALGDVYATIHLSKLLNERAPELWSNFLRFTQRLAVSEYVNDEPVFSLSDFYFGRAFSWLVTSLGTSPSRGTEILAFDLATDPEELRVLPEEDLIAQFSVSPRVIRRIRANACPIIMPAESAPDIATAKALGLDEVRRRATLLQDDVELRQRFIQAFERTREEYEPWPHVEQQIHDTFISDTDKRRLEVFHQSPWEERLVLLEEIEDLRLKRLGRRLIFVERPDVLPQKTRQEMAVAMAKRVITGDGAGTWRCLQQAIDEANELIALAPEEQVSLLKEHRDFVARQLAEMTCQLV